MRPDEFLKKHGFEQEEEPRDHTLRENAMEHAENLSRPNAGTPHDWEDWEKFKREHPEEVDQDENKNESGA